MILRKLTLGLSLVFSVALGSYANASPEAAQRAAEEEVESGLESRQLSDDPREQLGTLEELYAIAKTKSVKATFGGESLIFYPTTNPTEYIDSLMLLENPGLSEMLVMAPLGVGIKKSRAAPAESDQVKIFGGTEGVIPEGDPDGFEKYEPQRPTLAWNGYVRIVVSDQDLGFCSGILIGPDLVLTAAHCVSHVPTYVQIGGTSDEWRQPANQYKVIVCSCHEFAVPKTYLEGLGLQSGQCGFGNSAHVRAKYDLAVLRLETAVPPERAIPRTLLLQASTEFLNRVEPTNFTMFGYGYTRAGDVDKPDCGNLVDATVVLAKTRQRMSAVATSLSPDLIVGALSSNVAEDSPVQGAVCGDSGGPLTSRFSASRREIVVGVLSRGNSADGSAEAAATYHEHNRAFILKATGRSSTQFGGMSILDGLAL